MWKDDGYQKEKDLVFDAIVNFSNKFRDKDPSLISLKELKDFINTFFDEKVK